MPYSKDKHEYRKAKKYKKVWSEALGKWVKRPVKFSPFKPLGRAKRKMKKVS